MKIVCAILLLSIHSLCAILSRIEISDDDQPLCLDGTRFAYGFRQVVNFILLTSIQEKRAVFAGLRQW